MSSVKKLQDNESFPKKCKSLMAKKQYVCYDNGLKMAAILSFST